jgi:hypothetical protein
MEVECEWCGELFTKTHNRQIYCSEECAKEAALIKDRKTKLAWFYRNRERLYATQLGTRTLGPHRNEDEEREYEIIQNELKRLGLKS